jgi:hypothetical protein
MDGSCTGMLLALRAFYEAMITEVFLVVALLPYKPLDASPINNNPRDLQGVVSSSSNNYSKSKMKKATL